MEIPKQKDIFYSPLEWPDCLFYMSTLLTQDCYLHRIFMRNSAEEVDKFSKHSIVT